MTLRPLVLLTLLPWVAFALPAKNRLCPSAEECQQRCEGGDASACAEQATYARGRGSASAAFNKACNAGGLRGCAYLAEIKLEGGIIGDAFALAKRSCDGNDAYGCAVLGEIYEGGHGVGKDAKGQKAALEKSCTGGEATGCLRLAKLFKGFDAAPHRVKACELGVTSECLQLAQAYLALKADESANAAPLLQKACDQGDGSGCLKLAWLRLNGRGGAKDVAAALRLAEAGCAAGKKLCAEASQLVERACQEGDSAACARKGEPSKAPTSK